MSINKINHLLCALTLFAQFAETVNTTVNVLDIKQRNKLTSELLKSQHKELYIYKCNLDI